MRHLRPALAVIALAACSSRDELVVLHAASLSRPLGEVVEGYRQVRPKTDVRLNPGGSMVIARKVAELGIKADLVVVADATILDKILVPTKADYAIELATNEIVLAHLAHSKATNEVTTGSWPEVLLRPGVTVGCADPSLAPIGYHTLLAWQLCAPEQAAALRDHCAGKLVPDETEVASLLETRAVDYVFLYRSTAEDHRLKVTPLPPTCNLSRRDLASTYAKASVDVPDKGGGTVKRNGVPIIYALTVPRDAPHPEEARRFLAYLLGEEGRAALARRGITPLVPAVAHGAHVPEELRGLVAPQEKPAP